MAAFDWLLFALCWSLIPGVYLLDWWLHRRRR
jgi:hypothetical protein